MSFDVSRLRRSDWITGGGAVALFVFLFFFKWFGGSVKGVVPVGGSVSYGSSSTGWDTFTNSRWIWLITIVVAVGAVVLVATQRKLDSPIQLSAIVAGLGALSTLLILYRIIHHPSGGASFAGASFSYGIKIGIWLGLIAAVAITYGGYLQMSEEGTSLSDVRDQAGRAVGSFTESSSPSGGEAPAAGSPTPSASSSPSSEPPLPPPGEGGF
ncbi:MAG TPA: hypothetical protein VFV03_00505 [Solirubrobacteraceae bacterium]|nr:hypothetical protein [Solirubrobacteraceae bacterium]